MKKIEKEWQCSVCGYVHAGNNPPNECPQCGSSPKEFKEKAEKEKLAYDGKKFDVLLINGSSHRGHNSHILAEIAEETLKKKKVSYRRFNLNELNIRHCWCCYSMKDDACTYPCRNQFDDMPALHKMLVDCKAVIVVSPINWNNMSARLKDFLDRLTCIENLPLMKKKSLTTGKIFGVLINGHEDGAVKTAMDIFLYFQQMGFIYAPYGFAYKTHGGEHNSKTDNEYLLKNEKLKKEVSGAVSNVVEMIKLNLEDKINNKITPVSE